MSIQALQRYLDANAILAPSIVSVHFLGLLRGAFASGLLVIARTAHTAAQLAAALDMDEERVRDLCDTLEAQGVLMRERGSYRLEERWAALTDPEAPIAFQAMLDAAFAAAQALEAAILGLSDYWTLPRADRLALARSSAFDPSSPHSPAILEMLLRDYAPEIHTHLAAGGRYLELGCGVGGTLLSLLRAYPLMTAVGVELAGDVLAEARRQAAALGVSRRVVFYQGDARDFSELAAFDVALWSQTFFPAPSRALTLQVARYALKPGGFLLAPVLNDRPTALHTHEEREYVLQRVLSGGWDIPVLDAHDIQREIEAAGFSTARLAATPLQRFIIARRPYADQNLSEE